MLNRAEKNIDLPPQGEYAVAVMFVNKESPGIPEYEFEKMATTYNLKVCFKNDLWFILILSIYLKFN